MTDDDKDDIVVDSMADVLFDVCNLVAMAKNAKSNVSTVICTDANGNDAAIQVYGFRTHSWTVTDTFDRLADSELGDPNLVPLLAYYNGMANESEIPAGTQIKIPLLQENAQNGGAIYAPPALRDNYGSDIEVDDNGDLAIAGQDIKTISGAANLAQNIALRLSTASSKRIRLVSYGIRSTIGNATAISGYLMASIEQTVSADPRVKSVDKIAVKGDGDKLYINLEYTDINAAKNSMEVAI